MKVSAFISLFNAKTKHILKPTSDELYNIINDLIKPVEYISYDNKLKIIDKTIEDCKGSNHFTADISRHFLINLISAYTNLEMDVKGFDILSENRILDVILSCFESEYKICYNLMQMCLQDESR